MSTPNPQTAVAATPPKPASAPQPQVAPTPPAKREILVVSHCTLFYWWPVWATGFLMYVITALWGEYMVTVPSDTEARRDVPIRIEGKKPGDDRRDAFVLPAKEQLHPKPRAGEAAGLPTQPHLWMTTNKNLGVFFVAVLLLVITITNIPLRGLWSVIAIVFIISIVIIFALLEWWDKILTWVGFLDIRINAAGYLVISIVLFFLWLVIMLFF